MPNRRDKEREKKNNARERDEHKQRTRMNERDRLKEMACVLILYGELQPLLIHLIHTHHTYSVMRKQCECVCNVCAVCCAFKHVGFEYELFARRQMRTFKELYT